jgi:hypothetical protein
MVGIDLPSTGLRYGSGGHCQKNGEKRHDSGHP